MDLYGALQQVYNATVRNALPLKDRTLAGVDVHDTPLLDRTADNQQYKIGLVLAIYDLVKTGDTVDIVGFGRGVTTTHLLRAGASRVTGYEGAPNMIQTGIETVERNYAGNGTLDVCHAIVGEPVELYGDPGDADVVPPSELSDADVLLLDCEGSERTILPELGTYPELILCESHPSKGAPPEELAAMISDEYDVTTRSMFPRRDSKPVVIGRRTDLTE